MADVRAKLASHWSKLAITAGVLLILPSVFSAMAGPSDLVVSANAPPKGEAMTISLQSDGWYAGGCPDEGQVEILREGRVVYPARFGTFDVEGCEAEVEIPYAHFASANGPHVVHATYGDLSTSATVDVQKVVNWVYVRSFTQKEHNRARIDVAMDKALGEPLTSSVFASGTLVLDVWWEGCESDGSLGVLTNSPSNDCEANHQHAFHAQIPIDSQASTHIFIPWESLKPGSSTDESAPEGWYNVTAKFHNDVARANANVPMDPTVYHEDPAGNWFEVDRE